MPLFFTYHKEADPISGTLLPRPKIKIVLNLPSVSREVIALLDSGSDIIYIPFSLAAFLGLKLEEEEISVIGTNELKVLRTDISLIVSQGLQKHELKNIPAYTGLSETMDEIILGSPFFDYFNITFKKKENQIILEKS